MPRHKPSIAPVLLLLALGCVTEPTGAVYDTVAGTPVHLSGVTLTPGESITIQVLTDPNELPDDEDNLWKTVSTTTAATSSLDWNGTSFYTWSSDVPLVAAGETESWWHDGGLVNIRVLHDELVSVSIDTQTCIVGNEALSFYDAMVACQSHVDVTGTLTFVSSAEFPENYDVEFLSKKDANNTNIVKYYENIGVRDPGSRTGPKSTLSKWKTENNFDGATDVVSARYYNRGDLGIGRDMNCREDASGTIACYVANHGSVSDYLDDQGDAFVTPFATVAMEYLPGRDGGDVRFYVYGADEVYVSVAALDKEGDKALPGLCMACHGGIYDSATDTVSGATFLPFDLDQFTAEGDPTAALGQEESFRKLNALVLKVQDGAANTRITEVIDAMYDGGVNTPGTPFDRDYVPASWQVPSTNDKAQQVLYTEVVKPYCQACHVTDNFFALGNLAQVVGLKNTIEKNVCNGPGPGSSASFSMPHAQMTAKLFWESGARAHLTSTLGIVDDCDGLVTPPQ